MECSTAPVIPTVQNFNFHEHHLYCTVHTEKQISSLKSRTRLLLNSVQCINAHSVQVYHAPYSMYGTVTCQYILVQYKDSALHYRQCIITICQPIIVHNKIIRYYTNRTHHCIECITTGIFLHWTLGILYIHCYSRQKDMMAFQSKHRPL